MSIKVHQTDHIYELLQPIKQDKFINISSISADSSIAKRDTLLMVVDDQKDFYYSTRATRGTS